jgi:ABC-type nitrate/sulfonate/bicarbonate transport system permease component
MILIGLWQWRATAGALNAFLYGSPAEIGSALMTTIENGSIWTDLTTTALETLAGFALGNVIGTTLALVGAIVGEFMSSTNGLGHEIFKSGSLYAISAVFAELLVTVALALVLSGIITRVERRLLPWRHDLS